MPLGRLWASRGGRLRLGRVEGGGVGLMLPPAPSGTEAQEWRRACMPFLRDSADGGPARVQQLKLGPSKAVFGLSKGGKLRDVPRCRQGSKDAIASR